MCDRAWECECVCVCVIETKECVTELGSVNVCVCVL